MKLEGSNQKISTASKDSIQGRKDDVREHDGSEDISEAGSWDSDEGEDVDDDTYMDVENDLENIKVVSLFDTTTFNDVRSMLAYARSSHNFDLSAVQKRLGLTLLETIKLVNFIRHEVKEGRGQTLKISEKIVFQDDRYLQPALSDDALLYSLEDVIDFDTNSTLDASTSSMPNTIEAGSEAHLRISELQQSLLETQRALLASQYRLELAVKALGVSQDFDTEPFTEAPSTSQTSVTHPNYEGNYDGAELHQKMLGDKARTETYRNFILNNPQLFKDKVVLDVGCGTSILSLFCADAGAKTVYAVDQSEKIIQKAQEIVFHNGKQDIIKLFHGRIQDINLPVQKVDIIISEWMGYCLLFEAMLDSVVWARDRYLTPNGLMIPAQSTLYIAPFCNPDYRHSLIDFWDDVYGYDMSCFKPDVLKSIDVSAAVDGSHLVSAKNAFHTFNHYEVKVADLSFHKVPFSFKLNRDIPQLDGFAIWFDVTFIAPGASPATDFSRLILSTGPEDMPTHWHQSLCLIDRSRCKEGTRLQESLNFDGTISFEKEGDGKEGLDINIAWRSTTDESGHQKWILR